MPLGLDSLDHDTIAAWLRERDPAALEHLWTRADAVRAAHVGEAVHLRGLIEVSNHCIRHCLYCGIRACSDGITRYRMSADEILACAGEAKRLGYGTVVLQSGEDPGLTRDFIAGVIRAIKAETGLAITLSLGEREDDDLRSWKEAGADRFLLRFETSDPELYRRIHPALPGTVSDRVAQLSRMREMGYEIGSGGMVGIPGQTWDILARDIELFRDLDIDMIGIGPFLPSPRTPLGGSLAAKLRAPAFEQVPNDELTTLKVVALTRLVCPEANLPSTTALSTLDPATGRELGLLRGANIVMPNVTPPEYRVLYEIYPGKASIHETGQVSIERRIRSIGRHVGTGPGGRMVRDALRSHLRVRSLVF
jgi:biotin synthase